MSFSRDAYERNFQRLVEGNLASIETTNKFGRLSPAPAIVDKLCHCRRHNLNRQDEALLGKYVLKRVTFGSKDCTKELKLECIFPGPS